MSWSEPPPSVGGGRKPRYMTQEMQSLLMENPGRWRLINDHRRRAGKTIHAWCQRHPDFECAMRETNDADPDHCNIYVRYIGKAI